LIVIKSFTGASGPCASSKTVFGLRLPSGGVQHEGGIIRLRPGSSDLVETQRWSVPGMLSVKPESGGPDTLLNRIEPFSRTAAKRAGTGAARVDGGVLGTVVLGTEVLVVRCPLRAK
jgi:hypothetical protein